MARVAHFLLFFWTMADNTDEARKLMSACMTRAIDVLNRKTSMPREEARAMASKTSAQEKAILQSMYFRSAAVGMVASAVGGILTLRASRRPFVSAFVGSSIGFTAAMLDVANSVPSRLLEIARSSPANSTIADEMVCPAIKEFEPCLRDMRCRAMLQSGTNSSTLLDCHEACKARAARLSVMMSTRDVGAPSSMVAALHDGEASGGMSADGDRLGDEQPPVGLGMDEPAVSPTATAPSAVGAPTAFDTAPAPAAPVTRAAVWEPAVPGATSSWDAVRARYEQRQHGALADEVPRDQPAEAPGFAVEAPLAPRSQGAAVPRASYAAPEGKKRTNAYGDEIVDGG